MMHAVEGIIDISTIVWKTVVNIMKYEASYERFLYNYHFFMLHLMV